MARNGSVRSRRKCLLLGVEQTWLAIAATSEMDPTRTSGPVQRKRVRAPILNVVDPQTGRGAMW